MAFVKPIEISNTGLVASYWRLAYNQTDHDARIVECRLCGYADQEAREAGKVPLPSIASRLSSEDLGVASLHEITTATLYAAACVLPATDGVVWFADATAC